MNFGNQLRRVMKPKKKASKIGQFDHYKKWTTDEGYTFVAETKEDALEYLEHMGHANLGKLREVDVEQGK